MGAQAVDLLAHVGPGGEQDRLLVQAGRIEAGDLHQARDLRGETSLHRLGPPGRAGLRRLDEVGHGRELAADDLVEGPPLRAADLDQGLDQPQGGKYGMLITSPKGAFELRNQPIGDLAADTSGVTLTFRAEVHIQRSPGSSSYERETIRQEVPIAIFASDKETEVADIPVNAN